MMETSDEIDIEVKAIQLMTRHGYAQEVIAAIAKAMRGGNVAWAVILLLEHPPYQGPG